MRLEERSSVVEPMLQCLYPIPVANIREECVTARLLTLSFFFCTDNPCARASLLLETCLISSPLHPSTASSAGLSSRWPGSPLPCMHASHRAAAPRWATGRIWKRRICCNSGWPTAKTPSRSPSPNSCKAPLKRHSYPGATTLRFPRAPFRFRTCCRSRNTVDSTLKTTPSSSGRCETWRGDVRALQWALRHSEKIERTTFLLFFLLFFEVIFAYQATASDQVYETV